MMAVSSFLKQRLAHSSQVAFIVYLGSMAFFTYLCMYAFRKPFTAATFADIPGYLAVDFKTWLLIAQVFGYALSKFIGIKIISEMTPGKRALTIVKLILIAEVGLLLLAVLPTPWNIVGLFINGLPLGMIWGLVFSFLEGRRVTEAVGAILCACFVFGSGVVKTVGRWLLVDLGVEPLWMPFTAGALFFIPMLMAVWALAQTPAPDSADKAARHERLPMKRKERQAFFRQYRFGLVLLVLVYMLLTALRDFTDNFAAEIWVELGYGDTPSIFTSTSLPISLLILAIMFSLIKVKDNHRALMINHGFIFAGFLLIIFSTLLKSIAGLNGLLWFVAVNTGLYLAYIPFNCILFERLVACASTLANAGFLIYLADSFGYLASVGILLFKSFVGASLSWLAFTQLACQVVGIACLVLTLLAGWYFFYKFNRTLNQSNRFTKWMGA